MEETWGSSCHGAEPMLSRHAATRQLAGVDIAERLRAADILVRAMIPTAAHPHPLVCWSDVSQHCVLYP